VVWTLLGQPATLQQQDERRSDCSGGRREETVG
jgi:hypothetical protein